MPVSLQAIIAHVTDFLPTEMVHPPLLKALKRIGTLVGANCSSYYFEWHSASPQKTDLLCSLLYDKGTALCHHIRKRTDFSDNKTLTHFLDVWPNIQYRTNNRVGHLWLAFDYSLSRQQFDVPNIHCCIDRNFINRQRLPGYSNRMSIQSFTTIIDALIDNGIPMVNTFRAAYLRFFRHLSALDGEILHLSLMHTRTPVVAKLNVTIPSHNLPVLLRNIGWNGDSEGVVSLCQLLVGDDARIKGNICIENGTCGRFELELEYNAPLLANPRRKKALSILTNHKLLTTAQKRALHAWPGRSELSFSQQPYTIERWLDLKICCELTGVISVKPYLGVAPLPRLGWNRES